MTLHDVPDKVAERYPTLLLVIAVLSVLGVILDVIGLFK